MDIGLEESREVWKDLGSRRIRKSLEMELELGSQGTRVPHSVHMVYACMTEIKRVT